MASKSKQSVQTSIAKALSHPLRVEILAILDNRTASPAEMALELNEAVGNVSYHVNELVKFDCIELVDMRPVRGAMEHFYRAIHRPCFDKDEWRQLPKVARQAISGSIVQMAFDDAEHSLASGRFDSSEERHLSRTPLVLDDEAWTRLNERINEVVGEALDLQAESAERVSMSGQPGRSVRMVLMTFESGKGD